MTIFQKAQVVKSMQKLDWDMRGRAVGLSDAAARDAGAVRSAASAGCVTPTEFTGAQHEH